MIVTTIDENGFFLCNYKSGQEPEGSIIAPVVYDGGFLKPKLVDGVFVEGATNEEIAASIELPTIISRRQLKLALVLGGFELSIIESAINQLPEPNRSIALISWNDAITFDRNDDLLQSLAANLEIDLNSLFIGAAQL